MSYNLRAFRGRRELLTVLEPEDIQAITDMVAEKLIPIIANNGNGKANDELLTPNELAEFLKIKKSQLYSWVNESKYRDDGIPFMKAGKFLRFSKTQVFKWMLNNGKHEINSVEDW